MANNTANGQPTKEFFVEMLTRDIDLNDAILDLLDNCLDGVVRLSSSQKNKLEDSNFYKGYSAEINISNNKFSIKDNCGGIPRDIAENYAFRMGRVQETDTDHPTIGIYGIGMKRAIFKIGKAAVVHTKSSQEKYTVIIPSDWARSSDWTFPIEENSEKNTLTSDGTEIIISPLNSSISDLWKNASNLNAFVENLRKAIQESYSLIIQKGFCIKINGHKVEGNPVELLVKKGTDKEGVRPFVFTNQYGSVNVKLAIGFYAPMASDDDIDKMNESKRSSYDAGITVVCNDRVVLYNDKSSLTGWGIAGVPNYHNQFIGIKGIAVFESNNPKDLPMTTTKRGVDHSSAVYIAVKDKMCEGLKMFTNYTNQWKGRNEQERTYSTVAEKTSFDDLFSEKAQKEYGVTMRHEARGNTYRPALPKPKIEKPYRVIRFSKSIDDIKTVSIHLYGDVDEKITASMVGEKCFDAILDQSKNGG